MSHYEYQGSNNGNPQGSGWGQVMPESDNSAANSAQSLSSVNSGNTDQPQQNPMQFNMPDVKLGDPNFSSDFAQSMGQAYHTPQSMSAGSSNNYDSSKDPSLDSLMNPNKPKGWETALAGFLTPLAIGTARGVQNIGEYGGFGRGMAAGGVEGYQQFQGQQERQNQQDTYLSKVFDKDPMNQLAYAQTKAESADPTQRPASRASNWTFPSAFYENLKNIQQQQFNSGAKGTLQEFIRQYGPVQGLQLFNQYNQTAHPLPPGYLPTSEVSYDNQGRPTIKQTSKTGAYAPLPPNVQPNFDIGNYLKQKIAPYAVEGINSILGPQNPQQQPNGSKFRRPGG